MIPHLVDSPPPTPPPTPPAVPENLLATSDLDGDVLAALLELACSVKRDPNQYRDALRGRSVALLFEKPSLRTRASLEVGLHRLGAQAVIFDQQDSHIGARESVHDLGRNLERWFDAVAARVHRHEVLEALAESCGVPVLNTLSDAHHPCQSLADLMTLHERGIDPVNSRIAFVGDGNNVCHSLIHGVVSLGGSIVVISPPEFGPAAEVLEWATDRGAVTGGSVETSADPDAVAGADAVYTDAWISMGQTDDDAKRRVFQSFQVGPRLMSMAGPEAIFMHCLPAHRGEEVVDEVIDGPRSVVFDQAENRLHAQNAWFLASLGDSPITSSSSSFSSCDSAAPNS